MSDIFVYVQRGGDTAVWYIFKVFRQWLTVHSINTGDRHCLIPPRNVPNRQKRKTKTKQRNKKSLQVFSFPFWGMADFEKAEIHQPTKEQDKVQHYLLSTLSPRPSLPLLASVSFLLVLRAVHTLEPEAQQSRAVSPSLFLWLTSAPRDRNNLRVENV